MIWTGYIDMDTFFSQKYCDRCGKELTGRRIMSMFNTDCICMECKKKETELPEYKDAVKADCEAIKNGNYNYSGIGHPLKK